MRYHNKGFFAKLGGLTMLSMLVLSGCTGKGDRMPAEGSPAQPQAGGPMISDFPVKLGEPYVVDGKTYRPEDATNYDEVGFASWYGAELAGRATANGEMFNPAGVSAAHRTLPMPSYVEVTALDTGRTILVRINDRGPFTANRLIDLSQGAAEQLGISAAGTAPVRVRRVNPTEDERVILRNGGQVVERIETPEALLGVLRRKLAEESGRPVAAPPVRTAAAGPPARPAPRTTAAPAPATAPQRSGDRFIVEERGTQRKPAVQPQVRVAAADVERAASPVSYVVQIGAFADKARAEAMARKAGAKLSYGDGVYRVRLGPYASLEDADKAAAQARARGYGGARSLRAD